MKTLILLLLCAGMLCPVHSQTLSGRVYEGATGTEPPTANPLNGVTVELWGSNNQGTLDQRVDVTTTNSEGWYGLEAEGSWEFYSIKEINPGGYSSNGATSVGGAVKTADLIEYMYPLSGKTLTGNKFWDAKDQPDNNPPVAEADGPYNGYTGVSMTLDGSGSWDPDVGDSITQYQWELDGDGQYDDATGAKPQYTWNSLFSGTIYLRVYDSHNSSDADSASVNIREFQQDKAVIKGFKFNDLNQNGQRDLGEPGIPGWEIVLDEHPFSSPDQSTLTDSTGGYSFTVKPENDSTLCLLYEKSKNGWTVTSDSAYYVNVHAGQVVTGIDFGNYQRESSKFFDFGDVPTPYDPFAHYTVHQSFYLGSGIDSELAHQPDSDAQGDDKADSDDEDGIVLTSALLPGQHASLDATVYGTAEHEPRLEIWIDFDQNNVWDNYDKIVDDHVTTGTYTYPFLVPGTALTGKTYMRAIYSDWGPFPPNGIAHGEIEDYAVEIGTSGSITVVKIASPADDTPFHFGSDLGPFTLQDPSKQHVLAVGMAPGDYIIQEYPPMGWNLFSIFITGDTDNGSSIDLSLNQAKLDYDSGEDIVVYFENLYEEQQEGVDFGDAPDSYRTRMISNGASHSVHHDISIGTLTDAEPDGLPTIAADGDDNADQNDEDGVLITAPFMPGSPGTAKIDVENRGAVDDYGYVVGWIDFNRDNSFQQTELIGSQYLTLTASSVTSHTFNFTVPANSIPGPTYARFRLFIGRQEQGVQFVPIWYDYGGDGEVEDYMVEIEGEQENLDWGDAPSPYPAASHTIAGAYIGGSAAPDAETGMQRHPQALGDDQDSDGDDEDGFQQFSDFVPGQLMHFVLVTTYPANDSVMAFLWIDWNQDKDWEDPGEAVLTFSYNASGSGKGYCVIGMIAQVPTYAVLGNTFARVRVARPEGPGFSSYGYMKSGEVEDHLVVVKSEGDSIPQGSMLFGYKWNDLNGNGIWDVAPTPEPPLPNWTIWLDMNSNGVYDSGDLTTTTDASGRYQFSNLADGSYVVGEQLQNGWTQTYPPAPGTHTVSVAVGQIVQAANFGNMQQEPGPGDGVLKWSQPPLFDPLWEDTTCYFGWDEPSIFMERMAADDWFCFNPQPVTSIRWWGSYTNWRQDLPPEQAPNMFHLSIWTDVPRDEENEFSHPGERIWELFMPRDAVNELPVRCDFFPDRMDEPETCFRYHINLPKDTWFYQEGDSTVYWLCVTAVYEQEPPEEHIWGWKTRMHYFNDDAVLFHSIESKDGQFVFEAGEPLAPRWDLAFELGTTEYEWNLDFGDAPDPGYATTRMANGAHHLVDPNVRIGELIDAESDGQPQSDAKGDDANHLNDADGVRFLTDFVPGETVEMQVDLSAAGYVNVWLDIHHSGHWFDPPSHVIDDLWLPSGTEKLSFDLPDDTEPGDSYLRLRFSTLPGLWFCGFAPDGETQDYWVDIKSFSGVDDSKGMPSEYKLHPNIPNPFNPSTRLSYDIPAASNVRLTIYNLRGQEIRTLASGQQPAGRHTVIWDGCDNSGRLLPGGIYFAIFKAGDYKTSQKLLLLK